jgi:glycerol-3-phosphate O-acyltransferase/dihydroxyacetone phosphate acyltransferase
VFFTDLDGPAIALLIISFPIFLYLDVAATEDADVVNFKDFRPHIMQLFPSARRRLAALPAICRELQKDLRAFIKKMRSFLGEVYSENYLNWKTIQEKKRLESRMMTHGKEDAKRTSE